MKSIEITEEGWAGIPADAAAFTKADEVAWVDTKDIQCLGPWFPFERNKGGFSGSNYC